MGFDWGDYHKLSRLLACVAVGPLGEARLRGAISRSYYALFCLARNHLRDVDGDKKIPKTGKAHVYVAGAFQNDVKMERQEIGLALGRLRRLRNQADYDDTIAQLRETAARAMDMAQEAIRRVQGL